MLTLHHMKTYIRTFLKLPGTDGAAVFLLSTAVSLALAALSGFAPIAIVVVAGNAAIAGMYLILAAYGAWLIVGKRDASGEDMMASDGKEPDAEHDEGDKSMFTM